VTQENPGHGEEVKPNEPTSDAPAPAPVANPGDNETAPHEVEQDLREHINEERQS
jgi:hypothetical protein